MTKLAWHGLAVVPALALVASGSTIAAGAMRPTAVPVSGRAHGGGAPTAYVTNQNSGTVTPIATATNTAGKPIKVGKYPNEIAITP